MAEAHKDTIYIDIDDEITGIIGKVQSSKKKIVALVLPKRSTVMQSIINMKLLKRTADDADKNLVLITSESGLLPLAGAVGLHVAKTLQTKPEIPEPPEGMVGDESLIEEDSPEEPEIDDSKSIGELAGVPANDPKVETLDLDNTEDDKLGKAAKKKGKKDKKLKIPNFNRFRKKLVIGFLALIALIVLWFFAFSVLPKAKISITTDTTSMSASPSITVDTAAKTVDVAGNVTPGEFKQVKKTNTQIGTATGQKDVGTKASGTITVSNCADSDPSTYSAGIRFTSSSSSKVFAANQGFTVPGAKFSNNNCTKAGVVTVSASAVENGDSYNEPATSYTSSISSKYTISGSDMRGGTSKTATVVSQADIDAAKAKLPNNKDVAKNELTKTIQADGMYALGGTFTEGAPEITTAPNLNEPATTFVVNANTTYGMIGVKEDDLKKLIDESVKSQIDVDKQSIQDYGLDKAGFSIADNKNNAQFKVSVQTNVAVGPKIDAEDLKKQIAGKKKGQIHDYISNQPGVKDVKVSLSPFWVSKAPKKTAKITIIFEKSNDKSQ